MSDTKFTPGPWTSAETRATIPRSMDIYAVSVSYSNTWVALVQNNSDSELIAAAPEMYEALLAALPYVEGAYDCAFPDQNYNDDVIDKIKSLLDRINS